MRGNMNKEEILSEIAFWEFLNENEKNDIIQHSDIKEYKKGSLIYNNLNECLGMTKVIIGKIRVYIMSNEGREINLFEVKDRECCVMSASCIINKNNFKTNIIAEQDSTIIVISNRILKSIVENNIHVRCYIYEIMNNRMSEILILMQNMLFNDLSKRLSEYLIKIYKKNNNIEVTITQEEISKNIGASREGVSRILKKLEKENLISILRKKLILKDINSLKAEDTAQMEFISTASHEMRTPVAAIEGYLGLALNPSTATIDDRAKKYLEEAHQASQHLGQLFKDLLDVTKADGGNEKIRLQPIELNGFLLKMIDFYLPMFEKKKIALNYDYLKSYRNKINQIFYVMADTNFLQEIFTNLVENALKYTAEGGIVTITLSGNENEMAIFSIIDTGIGIPADDLGRIFQKFYRVDSSQTREVGGTGLGLYLVKKRTEAMNGTIKVESVLGKGSKFSVFLPRLSITEYNRQKLIWENTYGAEKM